MPELSWLYLTARLYHRTIALCDLSVYGRKRIPSTRPAFTPEPSARTPGR
jgi:hypothetical protein